jgi:hypothetical protein
MAGLGPALPRGMCKRAVCMCIYINCFIQMLAYFFSR